MKIPCPHCSEGIVYDPLFAGKTMPCNHCKKPILVTPLDKLPPEYQKTFRDEQQKIMQKQAVLEWRKEEQESKEQERQRQEAMRQEAERQRNLQNSRLQALNGKLEEIKSPVPEDLLIGNSYPILKGLIVAFRIQGLLALCLGLLAVLVIWINNDHFSLGMSVLGSVIMIFLAFGYASFCWLVAETIDLFVNMSDNTTVIRALLKRIAYPKDSTVPLKE